jgi:hypothetical protein
MRDLSLHILDLAENSTGAGADLISISLTEDMASDGLLISIEDNGRGIPEEIRADVLNPFCTTRTTRNVGLGLSLFAQSALQTGGDISVEPVLPTGTVVNARFKKSHIDMKPIGDIAETLAVLIAGNPDVNFLFSYKKNGTSFSFDTRLIRGELEGLPITSPPVLGFLKNYLKESIREFHNEL